MGSDLFLNHLSYWLYGACGSVILHVVVLVAFVLPTFGKASVSSAPSDEPSSRVVAEESSETESPKPSEAVPSGVVSPVSTTGTELEGSSEVDENGASETAVYVVKSGDTLTGLSHRFKCSLDELAALNGKSVKSLSRLAIGQKIKVPRASAL